MKKRLFILSLALVLMFTFTGCEFSKGEGGDSGSQPKKTEFADAADHMIYAQLNSLSFDKMGAKMKVGIKGDVKQYFTDYITEEDEKYIDFINEFLQDANLYYEFLYKSNGKGKMPNLALKYGVLYKDESIFDLAVSSDNDKAALSLPAISEKGFSIDYKKLIEKEDKEAIVLLNKFLELDIRKYVDIAVGEKSAYEFYNEDLASVKEVYSKYINDNSSKTDTTSITRDGKEIAVTEYKLTYDFEKATKANKEILEAIKNDEKLRNLILERMDAICDELLKSKDYEIFDISEEEVKSFKDELVKAKANGFDEAWEKGFEEAIAESDANLASPEMKEVLGFFEGVDIEYFIRINEDNKVDSTLINFKIKNAETDKAIDAYAELVYLNESEFVFPDNSKFLDLTELVELSSEEQANYLATNKEAFEYIKGYMLDAVNFALEDEKIVEIYALMEKHEMIMEKAMIESSLKQLKIMVEKLTPEELMGM